MKNRDNFSPATIKTLERRVGGRCSNPEHSVTTSGPNTDPGKAVSIGVAAHIAAAAVGGPRYDPMQTAEMRSSIANGIWLCSLCATKIDRDIARYPVELLHEWKREAEQAALEEMGNIPVSRRHYDTLHSLVFADLPRKGIASAITSIFTLSQDEIEKLDPRFRVEISYRAGQVNYSFFPKEDLSVNAEVLPSYRQEFQTKIEAFVEHGDELRINSSAIRFTGSQIFQTFGDLQGDFVLASARTQKPAIMKISAIDVSGKTRASLDDTSVTITAGTKTITLRGSVYSNLLNIALKSEIGRDPDVASATASIVLENNFDVWEGKSLAELPYFGKLISFYQAIDNACQLEINVEIEGINAISGKGIAFATGGTGLVAPPLLRFLTMAIDVLKFFDATAVYHSGSAMETEDISRLDYLHGLAIELPRQKGIAIKPIKLKVVRGGTTNAELLTLVSGEPVFFKIARPSEQPINLFGQKIKVPALNMFYSAMRLEDPQIFNQAKPGQELELKLTATGDSQIHVYKI